MAKTSTKKAASKRKSTKKRAGGKRNETPKLSCPFVANRTLPHTTESSGKLAEKLTTFTDAKTEWTKEVRAAFAKGAKASDLPEFPKSKFFNPNTGQMTRNQIEKLDAEFNAAIDAGTKTPPYPPLYNPVLVDAIHAMNATSLRRGSTAKHSSPPKDWDEKEYGAWWHEYEEDGETIQEPSGWFFDTVLPRRCHAERAEMLIDEPEKNILTFGNLRIVVGTGTHNGSAVFLVNQTSHGNYRAGDLSRKRLSLAGIDEIRDLVFKIEDRPNNGGGFTVKGEWDSVREMVYMPGQVLTAGFLYDSKGKQLDAKSIRGLDADTKGLKFKALDEPIVGKAIPWDKLWAEIEKADRASIKKMRERGGRSDEYEPGSPQTKSITNICVNGKRVDPCENTPFGLRGSQIDMPAYIVATGEGKIEDGCFEMGVVIGARSNAPWNVGVHAAKAETEEVEETPAPKKAKASKSKSKSKASKGKKASKASDEAPPVEADTAETEETEEAETETAEA